MVRIFSKFILIGLIMLFFLWLFGKENNFYVLNGSKRVSVIKSGTVQTFNLPTGYPVSMAYIPHGSFLMGSNHQNALENEKPVHEVFLDAFWIDVIEVTNEQFALFIRETNYITTAEQEGSRLTWQNPVQWKELQPKNNEPVVQISWEDANAFCAWRNAKLPSEAQWEKAARGTDQRNYPWGDFFDGHNANSCDMNCPFEHLKNNDVNDGYEYLAPVGSYSPQGDSPYGVHDMAGNVSEWTSSNYTDSYNIEAEENTIYKVIRGGSWNFNGQFFLRSSMRVKGTSSRSYHLDILGFRCVVDVEE